MFPGATILNYLFWMVMGAMQVIIILSANDWLKESGRQVPWWQTLLMYGCFLSFCAVVAGGFTLAGEYESRAGFYFIGYLGLPHIIAGAMMLKLFVFKKNKDARLMRKQNVERAAAVLSLLALVLAWAGGRARVEESASARILNISNDITTVSSVSEDLYRAEKRSTPGEPLHIALESRPSYGGPLRVAVVADDAGVVQQVAIVHSTDTRTYLDKVVESGILDSFPGSRLGALPEVDAISGATLSSTAIIEGIQRAGAHIAAARRGEPMPVSDASGPVNRKDIIKSVTVALLFGCALFVAGRRFPWSKKRGEAP